MNELTADSLTSEDTLNFLREKSKRSLFFFARAVLGYADLDPSIHRPICKALEDYTTNTRMMVVLPRTWFKSTIGSVAYPIWRAVNNPNIRILIAQNSMTNAKKKIAEIKATFETNELFKSMFPDILPKGERAWSTECLTVNRSKAMPEGTFEPAGTGTAVVSRHYDLIIEDDTVAPDFDAMTGEVQQPTVAEIDKAIGFHKLCHPLLLHPLRSQILIIGTRWAPKDLIGWILENSPGYRVMTRSALEKPGEIGVPATKEMGGAPVWDRFNWQVLNELRGPSGVGPLMFEMLYLNTPSNSINQVFKREYICYYSKFPPNLIYCTSVDPAAAGSGSTTLDTDYNVVLTTGIEPKTGNIYVIHYNRDRAEPGEVIDWMFNHHRAYKQMVTKIESTAYQRTLSYWVKLRQEQLKERFYIEEVKNAKVSKSARILGLQPWFAANNIYIRREQEDLERELLSFDPNKQAGGHDDIIDALSMQVDFWSKMVESYKEQKAVEDIVSPFDGQAIIDELLDRASKADQYPYDIGNMSERLNIPKKDYLSVGA